MRYLPLLLVPSLAFADKLPPNEVATAPKMSLPEVPKFELVAPANGAHAPRELMLVSRPLGTEVKVAGYVVAIYHCSKLETDPTACERPKLYLGDTKDTRQDRALWVVDYPRPPSKLERERLPKEDLAKWPDVPKLAVGDYVIVRGTFDVKSPHSELNSLGLIVYKGVDKASPAAVKPVPIPDEPLVQLQPVAPPAPVVVDAQKRDASLAELSAANKLNGQRDFANAIAGYQKAIALMPTNHLAFYGMGGGYAAQGDWAHAIDAFEHAVALAPDSAMYQMWLGASRSEAHRDDAREPLLRAVKLEPKLWRANYYLGRIAREAGHPRAAAEWFTRAIDANSRQIAPLIALSELYYRWDFYPQSIKVATAGVASASSDKATLYFVMGNDYAAFKAYNSAIEQFTLAIDAGYARAYFGRAQAKLALNDKLGAKRDFEEFLKVGKDAYELEIAAQQVRDLR